MGAAVKRSIDHRPAALMPAAESTPTAVRHGRRTTRVDFDPPAPYLHEVAKSFGSEAQDRVMTPAVAPQQALCADVGAIVRIIAIIEEVRP